MPETAPAVKVAGVKKWGGEVVLAGRTSDDRQRRAEAIAAREGLAIVPPFDHPDIVAGEAPPGPEIAGEPAGDPAAGAPPGGGGLFPGGGTRVPPAGGRPSGWGGPPPVSPTVLVVSGGNVDPSLLQD